MRKSYVKITKWKDKSKHTCFGLEVHHYDKQYKTVSGIHTSLSKSMAKTLLKQLSEQLIKENT